MSTRTRWIRMSGRDLGLLALGAGFALLVVFMARGSATPEESSRTPDSQPKTSAVAGSEVRLPPGSLEAAGIVLVPAEARSATERLVTPAVVEADQRRLQQVTPLIAGRVERVSANVGDWVRRGDSLFALASPQVAELQGNLRATEAKLAEADAAVTRTRRLTQLGASAGKELIAAETEHRTLEAQAIQLRQSLAALGATIEGPAGGATGQATIRAPMDGEVIERAVNTGAWTEAGKPVMTLADLSVVWVIAQVSEARLGDVRVGTPATIDPAGDRASLAGRVTYIDPRLDESTRTGRVRIETANRGAALKIGMFVNVSLVTGAPKNVQDTWIPSEAVQRIGERTVVFVATAAADRFLVRDVDLGDLVAGARAVRSGLAAGDRVVTRGAFTLKSQLLKAQFTEDDEAPSGERR